jgi:hypothetical protein
LKLDRFGAFRGNDLGEFPSLCSTRPIHQKKMLFFTSTIIQLHYLKFKCKILNFYIFREIIEKLCKSTNENGNIDHWWLSSPEELIGEELMKKLELKPGKVSKGRVSVTDQFFIALSSSYYFITLFQL